MLPPMLRFARPITLALLSTLLLSGCARAYAVHPEDLERARAQAAETSEAVYIAALSDDYRETFIDVDDISEIIDAPEAGSALVPVLVPDTGAGLVSAGIPTGLTGIILTIAGGTLVSRSDCDALEPDCGDTTSKDLGTALLVGGLVSLVAGIVLVTVGASVQPEAAMPSDGYAPSLRRAIPESE